MDEYIEVDGSLYEVETNIVSDTVRRFAFAGTQVEINGESEPTAVIVDGIRFSTADAVIASAQSTRSSSHRSHVFGVALLIGSAVAVAHFSPGGETGAAMLVKGISDMADYLLAMKPGYSFGRN